MLTSYRTVKGHGSARLAINKSLFLASVNQARTESEALAFIQNTRTLHATATHNCFAYITGTGDELQKMDDDGEPAGTAGKPILEVIRRNGLKDTVIVVTRYFGGIKLGAGGLIRAYGKSAAAGVGAAGLIERTLHSRFRIDIDYELLGLLENQLLVRGYAITGKEYAHNVRLYVLAQTGRERDLQKLAADLTAGKAAFAEQGTAYVDKEIFCQ